MWFKIGSTTVVLVCVFVCSSHSPIGPQLLELCMYGQRFQQSMHQPGVVANPARGQLNRENDYCVA